MLCSSDMMQLMLKSGRFAPSLWQSYRAVEEGTAKKRLGSELTYIDSIGELGLLRVYFLAQMSTAT